jgi:pSer/pThr/pTyr-binding forkhead associated (FHA) protein
MQATFVVIEPNLTPSEYTVDLPATIGRGREADVKFANGLLSRRHCEVVEDDGEIMVRDLGSRNGTFVGGRRIESATLSPGELITVGGITLRAVFGQATDVMLAPEKLGADAALSETIPLDDTQTVKAKSFEGALDDTNEWPEEESSLEFDADESEMVETKAPESEDMKLEMEELEVEELEWLDEPESSTTKDSSPPKKSGEADDDFDRFLEGLR